MSERLGRYILERKLAQGGMAEVYVAQQSGPDGFARQCVVKRMLQELTHDPLFVRRFFDEARLVAQLNHPNIAHIFDFGEHGGQYFLAMELVTGATLRDVIAHHARLRRPLPMAAAVRITSQIAQALHYAHTAMGADGARLGIVHRDVSPQNVLIAQTGVVKLIDFGVARSAVTGAHTKSRHVVGNIAYMSPEQLRGETLDGRSDQFSLGLLLYELLTSARAHTGESNQALFESVQTTRITPINTLRPDMPAELVGFVQRALAPLPELRYPDCSAFSTALEDFLTRHHHMVLPSHLAELLPPAPSATEPLPIEPVTAPGDVAPFKDAAVQPQVTSMQVTPAAVPRSTVALGDDMPAVTARFDSREHFRPRSWPKIVAALVLLALSAAGAMLWLNARG
ncbi:MAG: serine/threonine protein kinase [Myxococcaceae bacterium]|nr:serine/threonine protein kinase [Myxococcaceae bacterium]